MWLLQVMSSDAVLAEISLRSPRKLSNFIIKQIIYRIKQPKKIELLLKKLHGWCPLIHLLVAFEALCSCANCNMISIRDCVPPWISVIKCSCVRTYTPTLSFRHPKLFKDVFSPFVLIVIQPLLGAVLLHSLCCNTPTLSCTPIHATSFFHGVYLHVCTYACIYVWFREPALHIKYELWFPRTLLSAMPNAAEQWSLIAKVLVRSLWKIFIFIIYRNIFWIKASKKMFYLILKKEALQPRAYLQKGRPMMGARTNSSRCIW